jgi:bifunctional DNA primase/polymerase-like protein
MPKLVVPDDVNNLPMDAAFCCYRDQMKLHVYPVYGPQQPITSKCKSPGKQPCLRRWWDCSPQDVAIKHYFIDPPIDNIGMCPKAGVVLIDLDSKQDQGVSVQNYLAKHRELGALPRHRTYGGVHLLLICSGLPLWTKPSGKPFHDTLKADLGDGVTAEFFYSDHSNIVLPPSVHPKGEVYRWEVTGEVPTLSWKEIQGLCGFQEPFAEQKSGKGHKKGLPWHFKFQGDLANLDLIALLDALGVSAILLDPDEAKYSILCPWRTEHSSDQKNFGADSSTVIWQLGDPDWPGFRCLHAHCAERALKELLEWAEGQQRGIVDKFCARKRTWERGQKSAKGLPRILHPCGRLESEVHQEIAEVIAPAQVWFRRSNEIVTVARVPSGFVYSSDPNAKYKIASHTTGLLELTAIHAKSSMEQYTEPGCLAEDEQRGKYFVPKSFSTDFCCGLLQSDVLKDRLP